MGKNTLTSGNFLVDAVFSLIIRTLNSGHWTIKRLRLEEEEKMAGRNAFKFGHKSFKFYDRADFEEMGLFVTNDLKNGLFHAALHVIFDSNMELPDKDIQDMEDYLWPRLSKQQKEILAAYLPYKTKLIV